PRVLMDVKVTGEGRDATCTLYVGWDEVAGYPGPVRRQASLGSADVTHEGRGSIKLLTRVDAALGESMDAVPVASRFGVAIGFVYVQRDPTGATEVVHARVTRDPDFASYDDLPVSSALPNTWMGDNMSHLTGGLPGGQLLATWPNRYVTSSKKACTTIGGA